MLLLDVGDLAGADTVLSGRRSAESERPLDHPPVQPARFGDVARVVGIDEQRDVEVPVPDVADDRRLQERVLEIALRLDHALREP